MNKNSNRVVVDKLLVIMLGFLAVLFIFSLNSCGTKQDQFSMEECRITDSIKSATIDSLLDNEMKVFETKAEMHQEILLLQRVLDSMENSNTNLRNYIKHQDKMFKK